MAVLQTFGWAVPSVGDDSVTSFLVALLPRMSLSCMYIFSFIVQAMLNNTVNVNLFYFIFLLSLILIGVWTTLNTLASYIQFAKSFKDNK